MTGLGHPPPRNLSLLPRPILQSTLEFSLRLQEFVELARLRQLGEAISHAKKFLAPWKETHMAEIRQAMALLAFSPDTECLPYKVHCRFWGTAFFRLHSSLTRFFLCGWQQALYATGRWETLSTRFRSTVFNLHSLLPLPPLSLSLYTGLASLKTQACYSDSPHEHNDDCPLCDKEGLGALARGKPIEGGVPWSHHVNSNIVCKISGRVMEGEDGPMVLPNGRVYSRSVSYNDNTLSPLQSVLFF
jgi:macrophage erythroblast attacher